MSHTNNPDADAIKAGLDALAAGDAASAFRALAPALPRGLNQAGLRALALSALAIDRREIAAEASLRALRIDPHDWRMLIVRADVAAAEGRASEAAASYRAASAAAPSGALGADDARALERARAASANAASAFEDTLRARLATLTPGSARTALAVDVLFGKRRLYFQQPERFYFPELPQIQFYDPADFPWTAEIIAAAPAIRAELEAALGDPDAFEPYVPAESKSPQVATTRLTGSLEWGALHLMKDGVRSPQADRFPETLRALAAAPQPRVAGQSPIALFSRLAPGTHIPPHAGLTNTRLICHLPLITPEGCGLRVGAETRTWRDGEMLIFDDSIEHEARNPTARERIILLFDIWRPELKGVERQAVASIFDALAQFSGG